MKNENHESQSKNFRARRNLRLQSCARASCVFLILVLPSALYCKTPAEYYAEISKAKTLTEDLLAADDDEMSPMEFKEYKWRTVAQIRASLAPSETIEWQGATVETDNRWVSERLDAYEREETQNAGESALNLREIDERLGAIELKMDEPDASKADSASRAKDDDKQKLAEILRREEFQKPSEKQESFFARMWRKFQEWLDEKFPRADIPNTPSSDGLQPLSLVLQFLLYALIFGVIAFLLYRFAPFLKEKFKKRERREKHDRVILGERIAADETAENLFADAENLARAGDLRGAIRKGYVALLCDLADRRIIGLARHKTNRDYLRDLQRPPTQRTDLYENVCGLTANFERHWYGFEAVAEKDWEEFRNQYKKTVTN